MIPMITQGRASRLVVFLLVLSLIWPRPGQAAPQLCDAAAREAARATDVPLDLLRTLTRVETGRGGSAAAPDPWPWTVNIAGAGSWHDSAEAALAVAQDAIAAGHRNLDLGCFQINYRWHGHAFASVEAMMDPSANALYAAQFLQDLHDEFGTWLDAAAVFHSRNPDHAARYMARFHAIRAALGPSGPAGLEMGPRPALAARSADPLVNRARPLAAAAARPLWSQP